jgi:hypothetical protein
VFDGAGGGDVEVVRRGGSEPVGSAAFGDGDCGAGAGAVTVGVVLGLALGATGAVALDGGAAVGAAAGSEFCDGFPPVLPPGAGFGATFGGALGTGALGGVGADVAAGDGSALPKGCGDPLCGCGAFRFFCGGAAGSAGLCHGADASPAGRLS